MFNLNHVLNYFKEVASSLKFQISSTITFGAALLLVWSKENDQQKILLTILFIFPLCMFLGSIIEKFFLLIRKKIQQKVDWNNLTPIEQQFISYYINNNTRTRYMTAYNGTYTDSGIINPLISKGILYIASRMSEYRGESWMSAEQQFPINIHDKAFAFFAKKHDLQIN